MRIAVNYMKFLLVASKMLNQCMVKGLLRSGARQLINQAVEAELQELLENCDGLLHMML